MILNHLNLTVPDVTETRTFLEKYFGLRAVDAGKANRNFAVLLDDSGFVLTLIGAGKKGAVEYPQTFHIGFVQPDEEAVNAMNRRLKADGFDVAPPERLHAWTFYVRAPGGFDVEVLA